MCALQNLHFATILVGNTAFANVPTSKLETAGDYVFEILLILRDLEKKGELRQFCRDIFASLKSFSDPSNTEIEKFLSVTKTIWTRKQFPRSHIIIAESMVPFLMEMSKYYGYDKSDDESLVENDGDYYVINITTPAIRYDDNGELFRKVDKTPVGSGSSNDRCLTPEIADEMSKILKSPHQSEFTPIELDEEILALLGGVSKGPRSPSPSSYSEVTGKGTPDKTVSPLDSIPEEKPAVIGTLYISHKNGRDIAFINHLKNEKDEKIFRNVDGKKIGMESIFLSRFTNFSHLKNEKKRFRARISPEFLDYNRYVETQYFPKPGFMDNMELEVDGAWISIFQTRDIPSLQ